MSNIDEQPKNPIVLVCKDKSLAVQSEYEHTLVENIMENFKNTGTWSTKQLTEYVPVDENLIVGHDFRELQESMLTAQRSFDTLSDEIKQKVDYDPMKLITYLEDPKNHDEAIKLGLLVKKEETASDGGLPPSTGDAEQPVNG